jgi:CubicO group peptidase (beta-lactamase class C family)
MVVYLRKQAMCYKRAGLAFFAFAVTSIVLSDCAKSEAPANNVRPYQYTVPEKINDGWETASLSSENLDANLIKDLFERISDNTYKNITSVLIVRNGKLVVEEYFPRQEVFGDRRSRALKRVSPQQLYSATKSVTSILIGVAIERHLIRGVDEKISSFFPEYADIFADSNKDAIRLKDFLSMKAGLSWDEWTYPYADTRNDALKALLSPDPIRYVLERPLVAAPGAQFAYDTDISLTLGRIIQKVSGMPVDKFAEKYLFEPLGISDYYWAKLPDDIVETGGGLFLRPRDMAKIGFLFLNGGRWKGKQIISKEWVKESTRNYVDAGQIPAWVQANGYGYQWWLGPFKVGNRVVESYGARGRAGQFILVFPEQQIVAVFTGLNDNILMNQPLDMLQRYILPAVGDKNLKSKLNNNE